MRKDEPSLRNAYARYFFSALDASFHDDEASRRQVQTTLEDGLTTFGGERGAEALF
jgi:hypothetical protein